MRSVDLSPLLRILTHNIRYATGSPFNGEEFWDVRKSRLINELLFETRHCPEAIICLQEVLHNQIVDIEGGLNENSKEWDFVGVGRDDGKTLGEYSPIFYRPGIWQLETWKTVWLSETPDRPSRGWDAASTRILTMAIFVHRETHKKVLAMNTHLDDQGSVSRLESARLIQQQIRINASQRPHARSLPVFLAGDFNSEPHQEAYLQMTGEDSPMTDSHQLIQREKQYGDVNTYTGFNDRKDRPKRIDFIFLNIKDPVCSDQSPTWWRPIDYAVLANRFEDGIYNSDHRAVVVDTVLI